MSKTTTEPTTFFGLFNDGGFTSTDDNGHAGYGSTREESQAALERSQEVDSRWSANTVVFGWEDHE